MKKEPKILGIWELRNNLTKYLLDVEKNKTEIIVTQYGRRLARILPLDYKADVNDVGKNK